MKRNFSMIVICGNELVPFEVGEHLKVVPVEPNALALRKTVYDLEKIVTANEIVILDLIADLLNKDTKHRLSNVSKTMKVVDSVVYV